MYTNVKVFFDHQEAKECEKRERAFVKEESNQFEYQDTFEDYNKTRSAKKISKDYITITFDVMIKEITN